MREIRLDNRPVELGIDGQCDSPGHSATYCTVTAIDVKTEKVLDINVLDVKEVKNSQGKFIQKITILLFCLYFKLLHTCMEERY